MDPVQYHLFVGRPWPVGFRGLPFASDSVNPYCLETILFGVGKDLPSIAAPMGTKRAVEKGQVLNYPAIAYTSNPVLVCNASDALASVFGDLHCIWVCLKTRCPFYRKFKGTLYQKGHLIFRQTHILDCIGWTPQPWNKQ